jgi:hypothetical protein
MMQPRRLFCSGLGLGYKILGLFEYRKHEKTLKDVSGRSAIKLMLLDDAQYMHALLRILREGIVIMASFMSGSCTIVAKSLVNLVTNLDSL